MTKWTQMRCSISDSTHLSVGYKNGAIYHVKFALPEDMV
jgi:hypothetical protein